MYWMLALGTKVKYSEWWGGGRGSRQKLWLPDLGLLTPQGPTLVCVLPETPAPALVCGTFTSQARPPPEEVSYLSPPLPEHLRISPSSCMFWKLQSYSVLIIGFHSVTYLHGFTTQLKILQEHSQRHMSFEEGHRPGLGRGSKQTDFPALHRCSQCGEEGRWQTGKNQVYSGALWPLIGMQC